MSDLVRFDSVVKSYGPHTRLVMGDLTFRSGDRILVTGANGSGKSTLLRLLAAAAVPTGGNVWRSDRWSSLRVAYVPQSNGLYDDLSVRANLEVRRLLYRDAPALDETIERLQLAEWLKTRTGDLSGGFRRLVAVAAALVVRPDVLIMDEPLEGIDQVRSDRLRKLLSDIDSQFILLVSAAPVPDPQIASLISHLHFEDGRATWLRR